MGTHDDEDEAGSRNPTHVARIGIAQLVTHHNVVDANQFFVDVCTALEGDHRVREVRRPKDFDATSQRIASRFDEVSRSSAKTTTPLDVRDHYHVAFARNPVLLKVSVPERLQQDLGPGLVPAEDYWIAWNGMSLVSLWEYEDDTVSLGSIGGLAGLEIVRDAASASGLDVANFPCGPNCSYKLAHTEVLLGEPNEVPDWQFADVHWDGFGKIWATPRKAMGSDVLIAELFEEFSFVGWVYSELSVAGAGVVNSYSFALRGLNDLLGIGYQVAGYSDLSIGQKVMKARGRWALAKDRERLLSSLSVTSLTYQSKRYEWSRLNYIYCGAVDRIGIEHLFGVEYGQALHAVDNTDMGPIDETLERLGNRMDSRMLALYTGLGALAGGLGGAVLGTLLG